MQTNLKSAIQASLDHGRVMEELGKKEGKHRAFHEVYEYLQVHGSNKLGYWLQDKMLEAAREITKG